MAGIFNRSIFNDAIFNTAVGGGYRTKHKRQAREEIVAPVEKPIPTIIVVPKIKKQNLPEALKSTDIFSENDLSETKKYIEIVRRNLEDDEDVIVLIL